MAKEIERWVTINGKRVPIYKDGSMGGFMEGKELDSDRRRAKETTRNAEAKDKYQKDWNGLDDEQKADIDKQLSKNHPDWYEKKTGQEGDKNREYFEQAKKEGRIDKDAEYEDFVSYAPIKDDPNYTKKRIARETADENDAYDRSHKEGKYSEPEGRKTYRVHYEDGNQRLLEANSREELDAYLKETEKEYGKATKAEYAAEYDKKDTLKSTDLPFSKKESHGGSFEADLEEHSDPEYKNVTKGVKTEKQAAADKETAKSNISRNEILDRAKEVGAYSLVKKQLADKDTFSEKEARDAFANAGIASKWNKSIKIGNREVSISRDAIIEAGGVKKLGNYQIEIGRTYNKKADNYSGPFGKKTLVSGPEGTKYFNSTEKAIEYVEKKRKKK